MFLCLVAKTCDFILFAHSITAYVSIDTTEVDPHSNKSDSLHNGIVKPKNSQLISFRKSLTFIIGYIEQTTH